VEEVRPVLEALERTLSALPAEQSLPALAYVAGRDVPLDRSELQAARRRALLLLATGGDPRRGLALDGRAVTSLASDLSTEERGSALAAALESTKQAATGLPTVDSLIDLLLADDDLAWRCYACALLAEELVE
jgi:hypothetical protein